MIPVAHDLLKEKLAYLDKQNGPSSELFLEKFQAYQEAHRHWQNNPILNLKQKKWMQEMSDYIQTL